MAVDYALVMASAALILTDIYFSFKTTRFNDMFHYLEEWFVCLCLFIFVLILIVYFGIFKTRINVTSLYIVSSIYVSISPKRWSRW